MEIHFHAGSDVGKVRSGNEDFFINEKITDDEYLFAVADGMGGHLAGDVASKLACDRFLENYKGCRKKKLSIPEAMEFAIRKANQAILKKGEDDPMKKGMGTTFSAVVIEGMKAFMIHIGDSRIYFIRKNHISRLTTDHTFVEKLVENGRISIDEAREHPQKNVLYMSLGAREGFFPEVIKDFSLEDGDAFVLCTDGLNNMVPEEQIKDTILAQLPEDAARELIRMANTNGGTDNITLQIVRIGSIESLEKTKPVKVTKPRKTWITVLSVLGFCLVLLVFWIFYNQIEETSSPASQEGQNPADSSPTQNVQAADEVKEIASEVLRGKDLTLSDYRFAANRKFFIVKDRLLFVFDLLSLTAVKYPYKADQQVIPAASGGIFFFARKESSQPLYELLGAGDEIRAELPISGENGQLLPLFLNESVFIFRDATNVYALRNWKNTKAEPNSFFPVSEIVLSEIGQIYFKKIGTDYVLTYYQPAAKTVKVFSIGKNFSRVFQLENLTVDVPMAVEYFPDQSVTFYFADHSLQVFENGKRATSRPYRFPDYQAHIAKILVDIETGAKILVSDNQRLYLLGNS